MRLAGSSLIAVLLLGVCADAQVATVTGRATARQGDQILVAGKPISLYGIDAPDPDQDRQCGARNGQIQFACYSNAKRALEILVDLGPVSCIDTGERNVFSIPYMVCTIRGQDIGEELVKQGWALAFLPQSNQYASQQAVAKAAKKGLWQDGIQFAIPWEWRDKNDRPIFAP